MIKIKFALCVFALFAMIGIANAQTFPNKPVKIVTNLGIGSAPDIVLRKLADKLKDTWKVPVIVENRPGASGAVAMEHYVRNEKPDAHTFYYGDLASFVSMPILFDKQHVLAQLKPLVPVYKNWFAIIAPVNADSKQLDKTIKLLPFYGSWGVGSPGHICGAEISARFNTPAQHVPYKEFSTWYSDIADSRLSYSCSSVGSAMPFISAKKIKLVAMASPQRDPSMPNLPTVRELYGFDLSTPHGWLAMFIHKQVPDNTVKKLHDDINAAINSPEIQETIALVYGLPFDMNIREFYNFWQNDIKIHSRLLTKYNITIK
jgi:tripartite-type tricarboxylate transporter receptor subunit TctC